MLAADSAVFDTITTVRIRRMSGRVEEYSGRLGLPVGFGATFRGAAAEIAASAFYLYRDEGFGTAVFMTVIWGRMAGGSSTQDASGGPGGALSFAPQNSFGNAYNGCLGKLGKNQAPGEYQAKAIIDVANQTGVDRTLLAATWRFEGGYGDNPFGPGFIWEPLNGPHGGGRADIGPGQLNPEIWDKSPYTDGLGDPFGTNRKVGERFNGLIMDNLIVTARALMSRSGSRDHQAGLFKAGQQYTTVGRGKNKQQVERSDYRRRVDAFNNVAPSYDAFFDCLRGQGF
jgi:hypothetical protein